MILLVTIAATGASGCGLSSQANPSFALSPHEARREQHRMAQASMRLERPVLVLGGYFDQGIVAGDLSRRLRRLTGDGRVISVAFAFCGDFDKCRAPVIRAVDQVYGTDDPVWTTEVDVVAVSMGGLVARYASAPLVETAEPGDSKVKRRLRIARLFTISTPHRGAKLATLPTLSRLQIDMRAESSFLAKLDQAYEQRSYEVVAYCRLGDVIVGTANAAPPQGTAWWVANLPFQGAHLSAHRDPRICADIARRLRNEKHYATCPPALLPDELGS